MNIKIPTLTPYDTGERAQPIPWVSSTDRVRDRATGVADSDRYGRVDFDDDESRTVATVYMMKGSDGNYHLHIEAMDDDLKVIDNREGGSAHYAIK